jgi:stage III sporulation protein AF
LFSLSQDDLALRLDRYQQELNKPAAVEWKHVTDKLLGQKDEQVTAYVQSQVEAAIKAKVKEEYGMDVQHVQIKVNNKDPQQPSIEQIEVSIGDTVQEIKPAVTPIQPIQPVSIQIGETTNVTDSRRDIEAASHPVNSTYAKIADDIAKQWGLTSDQVVVTDESREREKQ